MKRRTCKRTSGQLGLSGTAKALCVKHCLAKQELPNTLEGDFQPAVIAWIRQAVRPPCKVIAVPNQRHLAHLPKLSAIKIMAQLRREGFCDGACDLQVWWDAQLGMPGNCGVCEIELKRPNRTTGPTPQQVAYIAEKRAMGHVAGVAWSLEEVEELLLGSVTGLSDAQVDHGGGEMGEAHPTAACFVAS